MVITIQQVIKSKYQVLLRWSLGASVILVLLVFLFTPAYVPNPYRLEEEIFEVVEIPDEIEIPPPPQELEVPKFHQEIEVSDEASDEDTIEDTSLDFDEMDALPAASAMDQGPKLFYAFDDPPKVIYSAPARYPEIAREAEMEGVVNLLIFVDERGSVFDVKVLSSTVPKVLIDEALRAARRYRFKAGKQRNVPVKTTIALPIEFRLRG